MHCQAHFRVASRGRQWCIMLPLAQSRIDYTSADRGSHDNNAKKDFLFPASPAEPYTVPSESSDAGVREGGQWSQDHAPHCHPSTAFTWNVLSPNVVEGPLTRHLGHPLATMQKSVTCMQ